MNTNIKTKIISSLLLALAFSLCFAVFANLQSSQAITKVSFNKKCRVMVKSYHTQQQFVNRAQRISNQASRAYSRDSSLSNGLNLASAKSQVLIEKGILLTKREKINGYEHYYKKRCPNSPIKK